MYKSFALHIRIPLTIKSFLRKERRPRSTHDGRNRLVRAGSGRHQVNTSAASSTTNTKNQHNTAGRRRSRSRRKGMWNQIWQLWPTEWKETPDPCSTAAASPRVCGLACFAGDGRMLTAATTERSEAKLRELDCKEDEDRVVAWWLSEQWLTNSLPSSTPAGSEFQGVFSPVCVLFTWTVPHCSKFVEGPMGCIYMQKTEPTNQSAPVLAMEPIPPRFDLVVLWCAHHRRDFPGRSRLAEAHVLV